MAFRRRNSFAVSISLLLAVAWQPYYRVYCAGCTPGSAADRAAPGETGLAEEGGCHKGRVVAVSSDALTTASIAGVTGDCCGSIGPSAVSAPGATGGTTTARVLAETAIPRNLPTTTSGLAYPLGERRSHSPPRYILLRSLQI